MAGKKITLDEEGISEILVADTDSESGSEASNFENDFEEEEEEDQQHHHHHHHHHQQQQQQASAGIKTQPGDRLKKGTQIFILLSIQQKV